MFTVQKDKGVKYVQRQQKEWPSLLFLFYIEPSCLLCRKDKQRARQSLAKSKIKAPIYTILEYLVLDVESIILYIPFVQFFARRPVSH